MNFLSVIIIIVSWTEPETIGKARFIHEKIFLSTEIFQSDTFQRENKFSTREIPSQLLCNFYTASQHVRERERHFRESKQLTDDDDDAFSLYFNGLLYDTNRDFCFVGPRKSEKPTSRVSCIIEAILLTSCGSNCHYIETLYPGDKNILFYCIIVDLKKSVCCVCVFVSSFKKRVLFYFSMTIKRHVRHWIFFFLLRNW